MPLPPAPQSQGDAGSMKPVYNQSVFGPVKCGKCGNTDQATIFTQPDHVESAHGEPKVRLTYLAGFRCEKCGHVTRINGE